MTLPYPVREGKGMAMALRQSVSVYPKASAVNFHVPLSAPSFIPIIYRNHNTDNSHTYPFSVLRNAIHLTPLPRASSANASPTSYDDDDDGVSLGTMKLPLDTDLQRFDSLLFQWANSLCQGANVPLPVPLKVDKIPGGARLGFITIGDGKTEVFVYIDCLVFPPTEKSAPIFRAIRNGPLKDKAPPGEPRIMTSLLQALQKSVEIARL
ncbi:uncharacterized protein LOC113872916 [Abrus precatorius]|uniref:Uncharacterized protein LOC113872916 n=1 Tax=Abrus precatorius TaxID=3816 RepID=A0A8B8MHB3_ABRPR|nr:uncharacterized protein LOC113872916 [Abrus precatorius]